MTKATKNGTRAKAKPTKSSSPSPTQAPLNETESQLIRLRGLTSETGVIHDGQILQLSCWTKIAVEGIEEDPEFAFNENNLEIRIKRVNLKEKTKLFQKKLSILCANVKWLLGEEFTVHIKIGRKIIYKE